MAETNNVLFHLANRTKKTEELAHLKAMALQMQHLKPKFTVCGLFTLNRYFLTQVSNIGWAALNLQFPAKSEVQLLKTTRNDVLGCALIGY